jgi:hypothetical protein
METSFSFCPLELHPQPWYEVWSNAIFKPTVDQYRYILSRPGVSTNRAAVWVLISSTLYTFVWIAISNGLPGTGPFSPLLAEVGLDVPGTLVVMVLCILPMIGALSILSLYITAGYSHLIAKALGGRGEFAQLVYAIAAYTSPLRFAAVVLFLPYLNLLSIPYSIYATYLNILSIKSAHKFGWGKAILSSPLLPFLFLIVAGLCLIVTAIALSDSSISNTISNPL